jgi:hypothetical protein
METTSIKHSVAPEITNPRWKYIPSASTNVKERFEDHGHKYKDNLYSKVFDFTGLNFWMWQITHQEEKA